MLDGLDLFSGIGGLSLGLKQWVRTIAYCEQDRYAQSVLLSRMQDGRLDCAPIWDDVTTLKGAMLPAIDIIFGGFPCQDISCAGDGVGLEGKRSGLFFEIMRLAEEIKPTFIFLENVPAIRTRGLDRVGGELANRGYDCRWTALSAQEVGANHKRNRWFLLGALSDSECIKLREQSRRSSRASGSETSFAGNDGEAQPLAHANGRQCEQHNSQEWGVQLSNKESSRNPRWPLEPSVGRVADGVRFRMDRIKCLGNAVVPLQAKAAFMRLLGMNTDRRIG